MDNLTSLQMFVLLHDTILQYTTGKKLSRNVSTYKYVLCNTLGLPRNTKSDKLLNVLGRIYVSNGERELFVNTCNQFGITVNFR